MSRSRRCARWSGWTRGTEWDRIDPLTPAGQWAAARREHLALPAAPRAARRDRAARDRASASGKPISTQEVFGRVLVDLSRNDEVAPYLVTTAPDVATSTNLAGFINRKGVFAPDERRSWGTDTLLQVGRRADRAAHRARHQRDEPVPAARPARALRRPVRASRCCRSARSTTRSCCAGWTPSSTRSTRGRGSWSPARRPGVTLAPEGGAHQSTITASVGLELPEVTLIEPAYGVALDWLLCDALGRISTGRPVSPPPSAAAAEAEEHGAYYFRLTTRPIDQAPFEAARKRLGDAVLRRQVLAGAYRLVDATGALEPDAPQVNLVASGAVLPEVLAAAAELAAEGIAAHVVDVTSLDRLYGAWQRTLRQAIRTATTPSVPGALRAVLPDRTPVVTVHDASSHAMAWIGSALGVPARAGRRRPVRPVRHHRRPVRAARPRLRVDRQRGAGRDLAALRTTVRPAGPSRRRPRTPGTR